VTPNYGIQMTALRAVSDAAAFSGASLARFEAEVTAVRE
jgi:hypothetical protein